MAHICSCAELLIEKPKGGSVRMPAPKYHDCAYVLARNALIPEAEATAIKLAGRKDAGWGTRFNRAFSREMERLSAPLLKN